MQCDDVSFAVLTLLDRDWHQLHVSSHRVRWTVVDVHLHHRVSLDCVHCFSGHYRSCWRCPHNMQNRVCVTVGHPPVRPSIHPAIPSVSGSNSAWQVCCWVPCRQEIKSRGLWERLGHQSRPFDQIRNSGSQSCGTATHFSQSSDMLVPVREQLAAAKILAHVFTTLYTVQSLNFVSFATTVPLLQLPYRGHNIECECILCHKFTASASKFFRFLQSYSDKFVMKLSHYRYNCTFIISLHYLVKYLFTVSLTIVWFLCI